MTTVLTKAAWGLLVALSALWALNHVVGAFLFTGDGAGPLLFVGLALVGVVATVVLLGPYRRGRLWAWLVVTAEVLVLMSLVLFTQPRVGLWYLGVGLVMAAAQLVTLREFRGSSAALSAGDRA